ncbi:MAG: Uma2 family endonuclease [Meiothermus sp.]|nr:Uma2 family endonuclease [Meiothermus sp.]
MLTGKRLTPEEYLALEQRSEVRHEYVNGELHAMAGDKKQNNRVVRRLVRLLDKRVEEKGCDLFFTVVKLKVDENRYRYPDVVVTCEEDADEYLVLAPCAIFEVLSDSTQTTDETEKLEEYLRIPSVERYVLLRQDRTSAFVYSRDGDSWRFDLLDHTGAFEVPCLDLSVRLEDIYAGIVPPKP